MDDCELGFSQQYPPATMSGLLLGSVRAGMGTVLPCASTATSMYAGPGAGEGVGEGEWVMEGAEGEGTEAAGVCGEWVGSCVGVEGVRDASLGSREGVC